MMSINAKICETSKINRTYENLTYLPLAADTNLIFNVICLYRINVAVCIQRKSFNCSHLKVHKHFELFLCNSTMTYKKINEKGKYEV